MRPSSPAFDETPSTPRPQPNPPQPPTQPQQQEAQLDLDWETVQTYLQQSILCAVMHSLNMLARRQTEQFQFTLNYFHQLLSIRPEILPPNIPERLQQPPVFPVPQRPVPEQQHRPDEDKSDG